MDSDDDDNDDDDDNNDGDDDGTVNRYITMVYLIMYTVCEMTITFPVYHCCVVIEHAHNKME